MIVLGLLSMLGNLVNMIPMSVPDMPVWAQSNLESAMDYILNAIDVLGVFIGDTGIQAIGLFLAWVVIINTAYLAYQVFWFVVKKLPFFNIRQ